MNSKICLLVLILSFLCVTEWQLSAQAIYHSKAYSIYTDKVTQGDFVAKAISSTELLSNYRSPDVDKFSPNISFKFSINCRDNEMFAGKDHSVTLNPINGKCVTTVVFGEQLNETTTTVPLGINLTENTIWTIRLDMRKVLNAFSTFGFYTFYNADKLGKTDFKGVYVAGNAAPLSWDFSNLNTKTGMELKDPDGDGIYETTLIMNNKKDKKQTEGHWKLSKDISAFPQYKSDIPVSDAIYNLATEEMIKAVEPDSTFRTGKEWAGVWTRDISYSIILSMAHLQPTVAKYSLLRKVKNNRIIQDTGTGGAYPVSTDRIVWAVAAWELYKVTGNKDWLKQAYTIIKNSIEDDLKNVYDPLTGMVKGESSFLDWREQTYPRWMQPADIFESECLGTNAVHYQANIVLSEMAKLLNDKPTAQKHSAIAKQIKNGINKYLWMSDKGYYGQYLYGRNYKIVSPRAETLGEALCVIFGIANENQAQLIISKMPQMDFGVSCIYPQIPGIPPYHNNAVWPFVQTYWALASAKAGNQTSVLESLAAVYRPAVLFLTDKENFVADNGDFAGTQINSSNMLWSLSGSLALVQKLLFGIEFGTESLDFHPFVPEVFKGKRTLNNFKCRNAILDIDLQGFGNTIQHFELDGSILQSATIPYSLNGKHSLKIILADKKMADATINKVSNYTSIETPVLKYEDGKLSWSKINGASSYTILKNAEKVAQTTDNSYQVTSDGFDEYQVIAVDENQTGSFASEPLINCSTAIEKALNPQQVISENPGNQETNGIEISKSLNQKMSIPVKVDKTGTYTIQFSYSNGNGPVNTENKCAIRSLQVDGKFAGTIVFPQRGKNEWSNRGNTNFVQVKLTKGIHSFSLILEAQNENMNGSINQAMVNTLRLYCLK
jgi:Bacterial alpha-L-rhamnosidase 6 hairpin glycosidase domain